MKASIQLSQLARALKGGPHRLRSNAGFAYGMMSLQFVAWIRSEFGSSNLQRQRSLTHELDSLISLAQR